jgi:hypothetical protein
VGYAVSRYVEDAPKASGDLPMRTAARWTPYEISLATMGADPGARVRAEADLMAAAHDTLGSASIEWIVGVLEPVDDTAETMRIAFTDVAEGRSAITPEKAAHLAAHCVNIRAAVAQQLEAGRQLQSPRRSSRISWKFRRRRTCRPS